MKILLEKKIYSLIISSLLVLLCYSCEKDKQENLIKNNLNSIDLSYIDSEWTKPKHFLGENNIILLYENQLVIIDSIYHTKTIEHLQNLRYPRDIIVYNTFFAYIDFFSCEDNLHSHVWFYSIETGDRIDSVNLNDFITPDTISCSNNKYFHSNLMSGFKEDESPDCLGIKFMKDNTHYIGFIDIEYTDEKPISFSIGKKIAFPETVSNLEEYIIWNNKHIVNTNDDIYIIDENLNLKNTEINGAQIFIANDQLFVRNDIMLLSTSDGENWEEKARIGYTNILAPFENYLWCSSDYYDWDQKEFIESAYKDSISSLSYFDAKIFEWKGNIHFFSEDLSTLYYTSTQDFFE